MATFDFILTLTVIKITVKSGIPAANIGNMLGRVLSGSKHGVRQTRGKFGLGAKMVNKYYSILLCFII